ncbi:hypothetical protein [Brevundimonas sp.]|jgi:hypothetical protein|uniref:hypothetical protein n=1 Tax=Brevundimonas sp. TaxID=1871086 RepID=UPI002E0DF044|nr:hypothetical protein [Brevundimonas sp.]
MKTLKIALLIMAPAALAGCDVLSDPTYWNGTYGQPNASGGYYAPRPSAPCVVDAYGNRSPSCYDYLFQDDQGNPLPPYYPTQPASDGPDAAPPPSTSSSTCPPGPGTCVSPQ